MTGSINILRNLTRGVLGVYRANDTKPLHWVDFKKYIVFVFEGIVPYLEEIVKRHILGEFVVFLLYFQIS